VPHFNVEEVALLATIADAELGQIAQQALKEMRLLVYELRPLALAQEGLAGALRQRLDAVERRTGVQAQLQVEPMLDLPRQVEEALYYIAQGALNNALKHAAATVVTVSIGAGNGRIELEVADNGSGFDPQAAEGKGGLGLTSMRDRQIQQQSYKKPGFLVSF
jgi:signal transduction histidine kinase